MATARKPPGEALSRRAASADKRPQRRVVALTGANTFLGRNLVGLLEEDPSVSRVVILDVRSPDTAGKKSVFYDVDLAQPGVTSRLSEILHAEGVDALAHLAFVASPTQATAWAHELESLGTMHLLSACAGHGLARLVCCSTVLVYGPHASNPNFLTEDHPLRGLHGSHFVEDKIDAERQLEQYAAQNPASRVAVLRLAPILGPTVDNYVVRWLSRRLVPTVMGFDPLVQFLHEVDALAALRLALDSEVAGTFNIVSDGVLPISTVVKLAGRLSVPVPYGLLRRATSLFWVAQLSEAPPSFIATLRYLCVADGSRARDELGFRAAFSGRDAVLDFEGALRLREARLLQEAVR